MLTLWTFKNDISRVLILNLYSFIFISFLSVSVLTQRCICVMGNFLCLLDWAYPDIWLNFILGMSIRAFWLSLIFELVDGLKWLPSSLWVDFILSIRGLRFHLSAWLCKLEHQYSPALGLELYHWLLWFSILQITNGGASEPS